jgi:intracellular sulfur oxidation DsrE/DsrF family protein
MMKLSTATKPLLFMFLASSAFAVDWPPAESPVVPSADGYVAIPNAALSPTKDSNYRAIFDATRAAGKATDLLPALNMAASELNALAAAKVTLANAKFVIVFHGAAVDGILDADHYKAKFKTDNPNLAVIRRMKQAGVEFFVCGQYLAAEKIDPKALTPDVTLAADALLVLMHYQNTGYALMSF